MTLSRYRKAVAAALTAIVATAIDLGLHLPANVESMIDPAAFAIAVLLVFLVPNAHVSA